MNLKNASSKKILILNFPESTFMLRQLRKTLIMSVGANRIISMIQNITIVCNHRSFHSNIVVV